MGHYHDEAEEEQVPFRLEGASGAGRHIVVTAAKRRWLDEHLQRQWRRPPTAAESDRFVADFFREEVLYREALALGLDRDDLVVRRRLVSRCRSGMCSSARLRAALTRAAAGAALGEVRDGGVLVAGGLGDPPPVPPEVGDWTCPLLEGRFGADFAASVFDAEPGRWCGRWLRLMDTTWFS